MSNPPTQARTETTPGYPIIKHRIFTDTLAPSGQAHQGTDAHIRSGKVLGAARGRTKVFRPDSVVNISARQFDYVDVAPDVVELPVMRQVPYVRPPMHEQTFVPQPF